MRVKSEVEFDLNCAHSDLRRLAISWHWFPNPWSKGYFKRKRQVKAFKTTFLVKVIKQKQYPLSGRIGKIRAHIRIERHIGGNTYYVLQFIGLLGPKGGTDASCSCCSKFNLFTETKLAHPLVHLKHTHLHIFYLYFDYIYMYIISTNHSNI